MVSSISSSTSLYDTLSNITSTKSTSSTYSTNQFKDIEDSIESLNSTYSNIQNSVDAVKSNPKLINPLYCSTQTEMYNLCTTSKVSTLAEYTNIRETCSDSTGLTESDYETEYAGYLKSRGCSNDEDVKALNTTDYSTRADLEWNVKSELISTTEELNEYGNITVSDDEISSIISGSSIQDLSNFDKSDSEDLATRMSNFETLLTNVASSSSTSSDLSTEFSKLSDTISDSMDTIMSKYKIMHNLPDSTDISETDSTTTSEATTNSNITKYNASLISNYTS